MRPSTHSIRFHAIRSTFTRSLLIPVGLLLFFGLACAADDEPIRTGEIIHHLSAVISWYRDSVTKVPPSGFASDAIYQGDARNLAAQAVRLAFDSAKAEVAILNTDATKPTPQAQAQETPPPQAAQGQNLVQFRAKTSAHLADIQSQLDSVNKQLASAPARTRRSLENQRDNLQGEIELNSAILDSVGKLLAFIQSGNETTAEGLQGSIDQLAHSLPEVFGSATDQKTDGKAPAQAAAPSTQAAPTRSSGLVGQAMALYAQMRSIREIDQLTTETATLRDTADSLRKPLRDAMKATIQQSTALENQAQAAGAAQAVSVKPQYDAMAAKFKLLSAALVPLSQEVVVLDQSRANLLEWRKSISRQSGYALRALLLHVGTIAVALGLLLVLSDVWRRATFRYVHDGRRRRQFLTMRRIVVGFLMGIVIILGFVSEFSSLATFAGFVTAGIAVGLQAVLLSIAAYFFLIGRYGIRVGERVSVAGVTGDVIDIGLVRLYLMELAPSGADFYPTGRVVVFSNSVFFQAGMPFYKQIPGTEYTWHEVAVTLSPASNYKAVQDRILKAVYSVYESYRREIERQHDEVERRIDVFLKAPSPDAQLSFNDAGLELRVRYPVSIRKASSVDDEITRRVLEAVDSEKDLKNALSGPLKIRAAA